MSFRYARRNTVQDAEMMREVAEKKAIFCASADDAPSLPGAYVLAIELKRPLRGQIFLSVVWVAPRPALDKSSNEPQTTNHATRTAIGPPATLPTW